MFSREEVGVYEPLGLSVLTIENELSHDWQHIAGVRIVVVMGATRPKGFLVELQLRSFRSAIDHGTQARISDG